MIECRIQELFGEYRSRTELPKHQRQLPKGESCVPDRTASGDDIFDQGDSLPCDVDSLCQLVGSVRLRFLTDKDRRVTGCLAEHSDDRDTARFQSAEYFGVVWNQRGHAVGDATQKVRVGFESVFVEVLGSGYSGAESELARQAA